VTSADDPFVRASGMTREEYDQMQAQIDARIRAANDRRRQRDEFWGPEGHGRMTKLCRLFPGLRHGVPGVDPWDQMALLRWLCTSGAVTSGSGHAAKFVLHVWNSQIDWAAVARAPVGDGDGLGLRRVKLEPFNLRYALGVWDDEHEAAFRQWVNLPFFP